LFTLLKADHCTFSEKYAVSKNIKKCNNAKRQKETHCKFSEHYYIHHIYYIHPYTHPQSINSFLTQLI